MSKYSADESYIYYPGTDIPINYDGIQDKELLEEIDRNLLFTAYLEFPKLLDENTIFNLSYFIDLHKFTFQKLYPFAGKFRNKNVSKGYSHFCPAKNIQVEMMKIFESLRKEKYLKHCQDLSREEFSSRLAYYSCELNAVHPFFEFNGRIIRLFIDMIAVINGYNIIDYPDLEGENNPYIEASIDCMCADYKKMQALILNGLSHP